MKVWTVILAGVLLAALPNLGNGALEDAGVFVANNYTKFTRRVFPTNTFMVCTTTYRNEWFRINMFENFLLEFENGNNTMKTTFRLGTPAILTALISTVEFVNPAYCKYLPKALHNATGLFNSKVSMSKLSKGTYEYYAVMINDTERATIKKGWNYLLNVVKNRFPSNTNPMNYAMLVVEKTAAGEIYVGVVQNFMFKRKDKRTLAYHLSPLH